jgi:Effector-associated domain 11
MENLPSFLTKIRSLIAEDELSVAVQLLHSFLGNSPRLNEALHQSGRFQYIRKQIRLGTVSHADATLTQNQIRFGLLDLLSEIEQEGNTPLPLQVVQDLLTEGSPWADNLKQELEKYGPVGKRPTSIFQHYGWLIEEFLRKMETPTGQERTLRRLSFMVEAFQNSLRYLCFIQIAQILKLRDVPTHQLLQEFISMDEQSQVHFDYLNLLLVATDLLKDKPTFIPEIGNIVEELCDTGSDLYGTVIFLHANREKLLKNVIAEGNYLDNLLDEYLTALVFWLCRLAFLYEYRLVSIKDINLKYRLGMERFFVHHYGELHGIYSHEDYDYADFPIKDLYTYNHSVLLFRGSDMKECLKNINDESNYISLSPLVIDQSVFSQKETQTPEVYYFTGRSGQQYHFAQYKNELAFGETKEIPSNKTLSVREKNINQPKFNELYEQMELVFSSFKTPTA